MPSLAIADRLKTGRPLLMDGGTGSELHRRGANVLVDTTAETGQQAWSATANIEFADVVQQVHQDYLRVGAEVLISNNFWTIPYRLATIGLEDRWEDYARAAMRNAVKARDAQNPDAYVAAGIAPPGAGGDEPDVRSLGDEYRRQYADHAKLCAEEGADVILPEYVGYIADCVAAVDACAEAGLPVWLGVRHINAEDASMQYRENLADLAEALRSHPVEAILLMCSNPQAITAGLKVLIPAFDGVVGAYPNLGYAPLAQLREPTMLSNQLPAEGSDFIQLGEYSPSRTAEFVKEWLDMGARIVGGCCASGPEHIMAMRDVM